MAGKVNRVHKTKRTSLSFDDIGWSSIAFASLVVAWWLMGYRSDIAYKYLGLINVFIGVLLAVAPVSIVIGVWKASFRWKFLSVAIALVWLVPFAFYVMSFAGLQFDFNFTW